MHKTFKFFNYMIVSTFWLTCFLAIFDSLPKMEHLHGLLGAVVGLCILIFMVLLACKVAELGESENGKKDDNDGTV
jgi:cytosine/uracil/thiamine/allantoin permease